MSDTEENFATLEALLEEVLENQKQQQQTILELYEKMQVLELQLGVAPPEDEYALDQAVDALYDQACACAETGVHISVPYLIRELQTSAAVAHEIIERLRIDDLLDTKSSTTDDEDDDGTDVFTTIDLKEINDASKTEATNTTSIYETARDFVVREQVCSQSALMKALGINQATARAVLTELEAAGVVSEANGRKGRKVLVTE